MTNREKDFYNRVKTLITTLIPNLRNHLMYLLNAINKRNTYDYLDVITLT